MTFRQQIALAARAGLLAALCGAVMIVPALLAKGGLADLSALLSVLGLMLAALFWLGGCLARPLHKRLYHAALQPNPLWRRWQARHSVVRLWLWIDTQGRDRDG